MNDGQATIKGTTGIGPLDLEHQRLVEAINETCAGLEHGADRDSVLDGLGLLYVRINAYVALEQRLAHERSLEAVSLRKARYHALLERIGAMMDAFYEGRCGACDQALTKCLLSWLDQHTRSSREHLTPGSPTLARC